MSPRLLTDFYALQMPSGFPGQRQMAQDAGHVNWPATNPYAAPFPYSNEPWSQSYPAWSAWSAGERAYAPYSDQPAEVRSSTSQSEMELIFGLDATRVHTLEGFTKHGPHHHAARELLTVASSATITRPLDAIAFPL